MRVWLVEEERCGGMGTSLEGLLRDLAQRSASEFTLVGVSSFRPDLPALLRAGLLHALIINTSVWTRDQSQTEILSLGLPILIAGDPKNRDCWNGLAAQHTVGFVPLSAGAPEVCAALWSLLAAHGREAELRTQGDRLQQRLSDRIIIEKAKGILMNRMGLAEEEAYQRLRMQSRRQRKQIREIAQSLLDTEPFLDPTGGSPENASALDPVLVPERTGESHGTGAR
jgi:ANTAR domain-containing protein